VGITVREALNIGILRQARVLAGARGLGRVIEHVDVIEMPDIRKWLRPNIFYLTSFYAVKDDPAAQVELVRLIADSGGAGLAVDAHSFLQGVPEEVVRTAEAHGLPLLELPDEGGYVDIITPLLEVVLSQRHLKNEFLGDFLLGNFRSPDAMLHRARLLGWPMGDKRIVLIVDLDGFEDYVVRTHKTENEVQQVKRWLETVVTGVLQAESAGEHIALERSDSIIVLPSCCGSGTEEVEETASDLADKIRRRAEEVLKDITVSVGVGTAYSDPVDLWRSFQEASTALAVGYRIFGPGRVYRYRDLGVYQFLAELGADAKLQELSVRILRPLLDYDRTHGTELVATLEAYLDSGQDMTRTARLLYIHRSSVKYRMAKIKKLLRTEDFTGDQLGALLLATKGLRYLAAVGRSDGGRPGTPASRAPTSGSGDRR